MVRQDDSGALQSEMGHRDVFQGTQADLPDTRLHRLQRESREVAGVGRPHRAFAAAVHPASRKVEAQLLAALRRNSRQPLAKETATLSP